MVNDSTTIKLNDELADFFPGNKTGDILDIAKTGDLIIRDLGYFATKVFKKMSTKSIFFFKSDEVWGKNI